jgi:hypothetical protein
MALVLELSRTPRVLLHDNLSIIQICHMQNDNLVQVTGDQEQQVGGRTKNFLIDFVQLPRVL